MFRLCLAAWLALSGLIAQAQPADPPDARAERTASTTLTPTIADLPYGPAPRQRVDVYAPASRPTDAPLLVMVHGGAWMVGSKTSRNVVDNKAAHWLARGGVFVSVGYRLVPRATVAEQAEDVAQAIAYVQAHAREWGADPARLVLMGHSAGAHLVALVSASPQRAKAAGAAPWLGTVALDSAALDVARLMQARHPRFYDRVFGSDPAAWSAVSPIEALSAGAPPLLMVCSTLRPDDSCGQSRRFVERATSLGRRASLRPEALSHADINAQLGRPGAYTEAVDAFIDEVMQPR